MVPPAGRGLNMDTNTETHPDTKVWEVTETDRLSDAIRGMLRVRLDEMLSILAPGWEVECLAIPSSVEEVENLTVSFSRGETYLIVGPENL
jgi:hypothetical protein